MHTRVKRWAAAFLVLWGLGAGVQEEVRGHSGTEEPMALLSKGRWLLGEGAVKLGPV